MRWAVGKGVFGHNNRININCCGLQEVKELRLDPLDFALTSHLSRHRINSASFK